MLGVHCVQSLIVIGSYFKVKWFRPRDDGIHFQKSVTTESIIARASAVDATLVNADKVILRAKSAGCSSKTGLVSKTEFLERSTKAE